jgi:hypothetical protein
MQPRSLYPLPAFQNTIALAFVCLAMSCTSDEPEEKTLTVSTAQINVASAAGTSSVMITTNTSWSAVSDQSWCTFSAATGAGDFELNISYSENEMFLSREASVTIQAGSLCQIIKVTQDKALRPWMVSTLAGGEYGYAEGIGTAARFRSMNGITSDASGNLYVADLSRIRKVTPTGEVTTLFDLTANGIGSANGLVIDALGNFYTASVSQIVKITPGGAVSAFAGQMSSGYVDGTGADARFSNITDLAIDPSGTIFVADLENRRIRKVSPAGEVTTLAGGGVGSNDGTGSSAGFEQIFGIDIDTSNNIYVASSNDCRIRKVTPAGVVTTVAGNNCGFADGPSSEAKFSNAADVAVDDVGNIYVSDPSNRRIRKISIDGKVITIAGSTYGKLDGIGESAKFGAPKKLVLDSNGKLYVTDTFIIIIEDDIIVSYTSTIRKLEEE